MSRVAIFPRGVTAGARTVLFGCGLLGCGLLGCGLGSAGQVSPTGEAAVRLQAQSKLPVPQGPLSCVHPPAKGHDDEAPWSEKLSQRLQEKAATLQRCTANLPVAEADLTLRMVYASDGTPISQHVAQATAASCMVSQCIVEGLQDVWGPKKADVDPVSYDLALVVRRGEAPRWTGELVDPLMAESPGATCVDADVQRLSKTRVYETISTVFPALRKCHESAVQRERAAAGLVTFEFVIGRQGEVSSARVRDSTLFDCTAIECMKEEFLGLSFSAPVGRSVPVIFPIEFAVEQNSVAFR